MMFVGMVMTSTSGAMIMERQKPIAIRKTIERLFLLLTIVRVILFRCLSDLMKQTQMLDIRRVKRSVYLMKTL